MGRRKIRYEPDWDAPTSFKFLFNFKKLKRLTAYEMNNWAGICKSNYDNFKLRDIQIFINLSKINGTMPVIKVINHEYLHASIRRLIYLKRKEGNPVNFEGEEDIVSYLAEEINSPFTKKNILLSRLISSVRRFVKITQMMYEWMNHEGKMQKV